ncbi:DUF5058 family protein [Halostagnicola kamekurae]|uniref:DUF5058 domain-containing protein n=1 Tax=Halostagnicola kamekurae TaxID=619731 RepID=A0A1I6UIP0_9EURY|nr:DUF5058 family protein [Halostagnicola kamekurae]SFT01329.1 protein of unknown function [Halostagnicola kamekurae]
MGWYLNTAAAPAYMDVANSNWLWISAIPVVSMVLVQAGLFLRRSWKNGKKMGLSDEQLKTGLKTGVISAVGPAIAVLAAMLALIAVVGGPVAWMRLSVIGSVAFELPAAELGVSQLGFGFGDEGITERAFATAVWTMTLGGIGWLIVAAVGTPHMEKARQKIVGGREKLLPIVTSGAMLGAFAYFVSGEVTAGAPETGSLAIGGLVMLSLLKIADENDVQWIREWALGTSMAVGLVVGIGVHMVAGGGW